MGFATALSGLKAASTSIQVTGNNIANSQTTGFKESRAQFADVYASSVSGVSKTQPGAGVRVTEVAQQFNQGNIEATQNSLDLAISGNGFFVLSDNVNLPDPNNPTTPVDPSIPTAYTRNGAFQVNRDGNVVNSQGKYLLAFAPNGTTVEEGFSTGVFRPLTIDTSQGLPSATTTVDMKLNLNGAANAPLNTTFDPKDPLSYNNMSSITTYDTQGNAHILSTYYVKDAATPNAWKAYVFLDNYGITTGGAAVPPTPAPPSTVVGLNTPGAPISISFTATGALEDVGGAGVGGRAIQATATAAETTAAAGLDYTDAAAVAAAADSVAAAVSTAAANSAADAANAAPGGTIATAATAADALALITAPDGSAVLAAAATAAGLPGATAASVASAVITAASVDAAAAAAAIAAAAIDGATPASVSAAVAKSAPSYVSKATFGDINLSQIDPNISVAPMAFSLGFAGTTQTATPFSVNGLTQDGLPAGNLTGIDVDGTGAVFARYSNGGSKVLGQVALARFQSNQALAKLGDTIWAETSDSGQPVYGAAGDNNFGSIQSSALEGSNVDLSDQLVKLIVAQQAYQANSQTITTEKTLLETILRA